MTTRTQSKPHPQAALPSEGSASLITNARLVEIYIAMLKCRMLRERIRTLAAPAKLRAFTSGSEAVAAAALIGQRADDDFISATPHLCTALLKGVALSDLLRFFSVRASARFPGGSEQAQTSAGVLVAPLAGAASRVFTTIALATGAAFAARRANRENVAVAFFEDKGTDQSWSELCHFALAQTLPLILVRQSPCPLLPASRRGRSAKSAPGSLPIIPVDSNDAVAVYRVAHEAMAHARRGSGPTLIDCVPLRLAGERRQDSDCIARMERYLEAKGLRPDRIRISVAAKFTRALDAAVGAMRRDAHKNAKTRRSGR